MRIEKYLGEVMAKRAIAKDKDLADWLGVSAAAISQYRSGARSMDNEKCVKVALELDIDPMKVIMATDMDKAERSGQRSLWETIMARGAAVAASTVLATGVTLLLTPQNAEARTYSTVASENSSCIYIM